MGYGTCGNEAQPPASPATPHDLPFGSFAVPAPGADERILAAEDATDFPECRHACAVDDCVVCRATLFEPPVTDRWTCWTKSMPSVTSARFMRLDTHRTDMELELRFFANFRDAVGQKTITREYDDVETIGDVLRELDEEFPEMDLLEDDGSVREYATIMPNGRQKDRSVPWLRLHP